ncbi:transglycosylase SLT domain-containing protein [Candidatus Mycalebacterium sp.]
MRRFFVLIALLPLAGCIGSYVPPDINNACAILKEKRGWYGDVLRTEKKWGVPIPVTMAFIRQESSFRKRAKQPRRKILWIIPWKRVSSASGYSQAVNKTWKQYLKETKKGGFTTRRSDFKDAADFIGWYNGKSTRLLRIDSHDAYNLYLAYHEGWTGYRKGTHKKKQWLIETARKVEKRKKSYAAQLARCRNLRTKWLGIF